MNFFPTEAGLGAAGTKAETQEQRDEDLLCLRGGEGKCEEPGSRPPDPIPVL